MSELAAALVAALGSMSELRKDKKANVPTKSGGSYSYSYTDIASVLGYVRPILAEHGIAVMQPATCDGQHVSVSTVFIHRSGETKELPPLSMPCGRTPQEVGSAITYARRYSLLSALGLATEDDDGEAASKAAKAPAKNVNAAPNPSQRQPSGGTLSDAQMRRLRALYGSIGIRNAAEQKRISALILGLPTLDTHSTLTVEQASKIIDQLQSVEDGYVELVLDETGSVVGFTDAQPTNLLGEDGAS